MAQPIKQDISTGDGLVNELDQPIRGISLWKDA